MSRIELCEINFSHKYSSKNIPKKHSLPLSGDLLLSWQPSENKKYLLDGFREERPIIRNIDRPSLHMVKSLGVKYSLTEHKKQSLVATVTA